MEGYDGALCEVISDHCRVGKQPKCLNGGECINQTDGYTCSCPPGFSGTTCDRGVLQAQRKHRYSRARGDSQLTLMRGCFAYSALRAASRCNGSVRADSMPRRRKSRHSVYVVLPRRLCSYRHNSQQHANLRIGRDLDGNHRRAVVLHTAILRQIARKLGTKREPGPGDHAFVFTSRCRAQVGPG